MESRDSPVLPWTCAECRAPLMPTSNGAVCPNGHGLLHPPLPRHIAHCNSALIAGVPAARMEGPHYYINGVRCRRSNIFTGTIKDMLFSREIVAVCGDRVHVFRPIGEE